MGWNAFWLVPLAVAGLMFACGGTGTPEVEEAPGTETAAEQEAEAVADDPAAGDDEQPAALPPAGGATGDVVGERESTLIAAIADHIDALNALDREAFVGRFIDDCGDAAGAGAFSYAFAAPLVEAGAVVRSDFESIVFLDGDRAEVIYRSTLLGDLWVVRDEVWWISTCSR